MSGPVGSGEFSRNVGIIFIAAAAIVLALDYWKIPIVPVYALALWLLASGYIAIKWGRQRIKESTAVDQHGNKSKYATDKRVGQKTINMIAASLQLRLLSLRLCWFPNRKRPLLPRHRAPSRASNQATELRERRPRQRVA